MSSFPYLKLSKFQRLYLVAFAAGDEPTDICAEYDLDMTTVRQWRVRSDLFRKAEAEIERDPRWATRAIVTPMAIARRSKHLINGMYGIDGATFKEMNGKELELLMTMGGLMGPNQEIEPGGLADVIARMGNALRLPELNPPAQIVDAQYTVTAEPPSDPIPRR